MSVPFFTALWMPRHGIRCLLFVPFFGLVLVRFCRHKPGNYRGSVALISQPQGRLRPRLARWPGYRGVRKGLARALPEGGVNLQSFTHSVEVSSHAPAVVPACGLTESLGWLEQHRWCFCVAHLFVRQAYTANELRAWYHAAARKSGTMR